MRNHLGILSTALLTGLAGCDPSYGFQYRQTLRPAPAEDCVTSALGASSLVASVTPAARGPLYIVHEPGLQVTLRDTSAKGGTWTAYVTRVPLSDSVARVAVTYAFMNYSPPSAAQVQRWATLAGELLASVRVACAQQAVPSLVECRRMGPVIGKRSCSAA
jgi:hypothetical protein